MSGWMILGLILALIVGFFTGILVAAIRASEEIYEQIGWHAWKTCVEVIEDINTERKKADRRLINPLLVESFLEHLEEERMVHVRFRSLVDEDYTEGDNPELSKEYKKKSGGRGKRIRKIKGFRYLVPGYSSV